MRTNSKEVKQKIQAYIIDCIDVSVFTEDKLNIKEQLEIVVGEFNRVAVYPNNFKRLKTNQAVFKDYIMGLPSTLNFEYWNDGILEVMKSFGLPLPANKDDSEGIDLFYYLVFREFNVLLKKHDLELIGTVVV